MERISVTISFGTAPAPVVRNEVANGAAPVCTVSEAIDCDRIVSEVQKQLIAIGVGSVAPVKYDAEQAKIIQRLNDRLVYPRGAGIHRNENFKNATAIASLAQKSEREE
jgi:hypothetical protein